ncbi:phosphoribosyl-ATP diphosphatase [Lutibaculum baratangense]|uniref:Phosphoribosyl-ATP pyrophosphatase n=1 Tax=Lutibaculum baratangense AMV1 TaxID=631454 RepID=V4R266_9HYPH|nr:phosphoribosyl-ATP diphosphatase [Lutibaculum baratangense]ESR26037.1 Phosphoribosyl-ATP pyrophosphatase [Lutibaculum baratangense AMV1]
MSEERVTIEDLVATVASRRGESPDASYTAQLLHRGVRQCAKKFGEEAVELVIAAAAEDRPNVKAEAADVLYHLAVLLEAAGVTLDDVYAELGRRRAMSGLAEKAARKA